ncbi:18969_t:CDS:10 [Racocetra persica]|uniref:18969_t:CDS:1 n=1 Tax=Racocetra persica TaxID=160502 RepID=A0ACA9KZJ8_9GLOM|nr:18969_t:CDS:10 [Racocetra persica]
MDENSPLIQRSKSVAAYNRDLSDSSDRQQKTFKSPKSYSISKKPSIYTNLLSVPIHFDRISENGEAWVKSQNDFFKRAGKAPSIRRRLAYKYDTGKKGRIWELFDAFLSIPEECDQACVIFFDLKRYSKFFTNQSTYYVIKDVYEFPNILRIMDFILACLILIQFLPRVWLAKNYLQYLANSLAITTWISVFPVIAAFITRFFIREMDNTYMGVDRFVYVYPLRFFRALVSVHLCFTPVKSSLFRMSKLLRKGLKISTTILFTILAVSSWIHIITYYDELSEGIDYFDATWFTVAEKNIEHIIITGSFDAMSLFEFLREFFCQDHGMTTMNTFALILNPDEPDDDTALLLEDPAFINRVQYIKGSPAFRRSLEKVKADTASAAFLLSPKFSSNRDKDDAAQIIRSLALKKYNRELPLYVQVLLPENVPHFDLLAKDILCIDEISMGLMAQSLVTPGFASLIVLLTISITDQIAHELKVNANHIKGANTWAIEYINGAQYEIYAASLSDYFRGKTFLECSEIIYTQLDVTLFAIGAVKSQLGALFNHSYPFQIFLNPQDYVIKGDEIVFVISDNAEIALRLAQFNKPDHEGSLAQDTESVVIQSTHKLDDDGHYSSNDALSVPISQSKLARQKSLSEEESRIQVSSLVENTHVFSAPMTTSLRAEILKHNIIMARANCDESLIDSEIKNIKNHVLICDNSDEFPLNLDIFIMVLRENNSKCHNMPVVILSYSQPSESQKRALKKFKDVYFVHGSPLRRNDLFRARAHVAKKCMILSSVTSHYGTNDGTADATSLMTALNIEALALDDCFILVECVHRETFKMIGESDSIKNNQEDYNDESLSPKIDIQQDDGNYWTNLGLSSGHVFQVEIPPLYIGQKYKALHRHLVRAHKAIALGLYRYVIHNNQGLRYVYVSPDKNCILKENDLVYIIASKSPVFDEDISTVPEE